MAIQSTVPSIFSAAGFSQAVLSGAAVRIENEDEDGAVFARDLDRLSRGGALLKPVEVRFRIVVWNPFADGLPGWFDGLERRIRRRRNIDDAFPNSVEEVAGIAGEGEVLLMRAIGAMEAESAQPSHTG
jgi:hypothetical protein